VFGLVSLLDYIELDSRFLCMPLNLAEFLRRPAGGHIVSPSFWVTSISSYASFLHTIHPTIAVRFALFFQIALYAPRPFSRPPAIPHLCAGRRSSSGFKFCGVLLVRHLETLWLQSICNPIEFVDAAPPYLVVASYAA